MKLEVYNKGEVVGHTEIDEGDYVWACQYRWHLTRAGYVTRFQRRGHDSKPTAMLLHREVLGLKHGYRDVLVDHIDGDPLNNLRSNLRHATHAQNAQNRKIAANNRSGYKGVSWFTAKGMWRVQVMVDGKRTLVGYYDDVHEAGRAAQNFYAENVPFANVTAPQPGTRGEPSARHTALGPGC